MFTYAFTSSKALFILFCRFRFTSGTTSVLPGRRPFLQYWGYFATDSLSFHLYEDSLFFLYFWRGFVVHWLLGWHFFFPFSSLQMSLAVFLMNFWLHSHYCSLSFLLWSRPHIFVVVSLVFNIRWHFLMANWKSCSDRLLFLLSFECFCPILSILP